MDTNTPNLPQEALDAIRAGNTILAIKATREALGIGLAEAKYLVESQMAAMPDAAPKQEETARPASPSKPVAAPSVHRAGANGRNAALIGIALALAAAGLLAYLLLH